MLSIAETCVAIAKKKGAKDASARAYRVRDVSMDWRDGKVEKISDATTRGVGLQLYVDGRYSTASTSDLRPEALDRFIADAIALAKTLTEDPFRVLPDPELYKGQASIDLKIDDPKYATVTADARRKLVKEMEAAARGVEGSDSILSVTTSWSDSLNESFLVTSNGFSGQRRDTSFFISASVSVKDKDGRRPEDYAYAGSRIYGELPAAAAIGRDAASRAISRLGSKKGESAQLPMVIDNRAAGRMVSFLGQALSGAALQQKRSFLEGKLGEQIASDIVTIVDDPLIPKAFGSRLFDYEGIAAKPRPMIEAGILKNFYIDTYYGRKLKMAPTSGSTSNLSWKLGAKSQPELLKDVKDGIFVTSFLGGNSNSLTGDFSVGVQGFRIREGKLAEAIGEMNISGNHLEFWKKVTAVGNDPYPYSSLRTPTLVFDGVSFAGV
jgi:PmbA protein